MSDITSPNTGANLSDDAKAELEKSQNKRIESQVINLVLNHPFFASLLLNFERKVSWDIPTFATDGKHIYVNPKFCESLTESEIRGVLVHEILHCTFGHLWRRNDRDPQRWNMATDFQINDYIHQINDDYTSRGQAAPFELPEGHLHDLAYRGLSSEETYSKLPDPPPSESGGGGTGEAGDGGTQPWDFGSFLDPDEGDPNDPYGNGNTEEEWGMRAARAAQAAKMQGKLPASIQNMVDEITRGEVEWTDILNKYVTETLAMQDYNETIFDRRFAQMGIMFPDMDGKRVGDVVFAVDTSGSCIGHVAEFLGEGQAILEDFKPERLLVIECDAGIDPEKSVREYRPGDQIFKDYTGGGGTSFAPVFEYLDETGTIPQVMVYMTDGYGSHYDKDPGYPVIWVMPPGSDKDVPFGEVVEMREG